MLDALIKGAIAAFLLVTIGGCGQQATLVRDRIQTASIPVAVRCAGGDKPAPVTPLNQRFTADQWKAFTPKQKAEHAAAQALRHQNFGIDLTAATSTCWDLPAAPAS